jgi:hypothetical protein
LTHKEQKALMKLRNSLNRIETKLKNIAFEIATITDTSNLYWSKLSRDARKTYNEARIIFAKWSHSNLPSIYDDQIRRQIKRIKNMSFTPKAVSGKPIKVNYFTFVSNNANKQIKTSIIKDSIMYFSTGCDEGYKQLNRLMNLTQQINLTDKAVKQAINTGLLKGGVGLRDERLVGRGTIYGAQRRLQQDLLKKAIDGKFIKIIDKNGNDRLYNVRAYADMVARTEINKSQGQGCVNTALQYNSDLIQISSHNTTTPICQQYEGKIYSITGKDRLFPTLVELNPFHPNCKHTSTVIFREVLERRGIKEYSDFSLGKTEKHPTRKSHVPVSKR